MDQADRPPLDQVFAGLLNGVAVSSIGAAVPAFFAWGGITHYDGHAASFQVSDLLAEPADTLIAVVLLLASARILLFGVRLTGRSLAQLRARRAS